MCVSFGIILKGNHSLAHSRKSYLLFGLFFKVYISYKGYK